MIKIIILKKNYSIKNIITFEKKYKKIQKINVVEDKYNKLIIHVKYNYEKGIDCLEFVYLFNLNKILNENNLKIKNINLKRIYGFFNTMSLK